MYTLLLAALMTVFSLAACGSNEGGSVSGSGSANDGGAGSGSTAAAGSVSGSGSANDDGMGGMTGSGGSGSSAPADSGLNGGQGGSSIAGSSNGSSSAAGSSGSGSSGSGASGSGDALTRGARDAVRGTENAVSDVTGGLLRGASYEQMLRNARVHDTDGDLYDYENAMTPGTRYF